MSLPTRPGFQKPTKSSSSSSSSASASGGGAASARWNGNYSAGVSPVRGLSPVRGTFHGVMRQDIDMARSHTNPLFSTTRTTDTGRTNNTPTKASKDSKENREKQEPWKVPTEKSQYGSKTLCTTPGKSSRTTATMRFTTPPKPVVKRKILAENREFGTGTPTRMKEEEIKQVAATSSTARRELLVAEPVAVSQSRNDESQCRAGDKLSSLSPERSSAEPNKPENPLVSIEELQKRIQKFLQDEGTTTTTTGDVSSVTMSPRQSIESLRRSLSGGVAGEESSSFTGLEEGAPFQPVVAPYSPRPEFLRARKSPTTPVSMEGNVSPVRGEDSLIQEKTTPTYDPKNNFLSPRPQFLRYRPLRRLELLRKSAEGTLADLDLESPATDAESSRMGSEKDEKEESELSQDVSQEIQSLKSSLESPPQRKVESGLSQDVSQELHSLKSSPDSPPRCKVSPHELFKSADPVNGDIVQLDREEPEPNIPGVQYPPKAEDPTGVDVHSARSEFQDLTKEEDQKELEDADPDNNSSSAWYNAFGIVTVLALVALAVVASGSTSLLPVSLHESHISHLWKTSRATEPIRQFLQSTEGLWAENPYLRDFRLSSPDILRVGWVHISSRIQSLDFSEALESCKVLWSACMEYSATFRRLAKESFYNFKAQLEEEMEFYSSHSQQEVNEWDWVPDYEFVVPHDMFDPGEAYTNIMARVQSWEVKSFWSSLIQSYTKLHPSALVSEQCTDENLDSGRESRNSSLCSLPASPEVELILSFHPAPAIGCSVIADVPDSPPSQDFQRNSNVPEQSERTDINLNEPYAVRGGLLQESLVSVQDDEEELAVATVETELSAPDVVNTGVENAADAIVEVQPLLSPAAGVVEDVQVVEPILSQEQRPEVVQLRHDAKEIEQGYIVEDLRMPDTILSQDQRVEAVQSWHDAEEIHQGRIVEDLEVLDPKMSRDQPLSLQESLQGEGSSVRQAMAIPVPSILEENNVDSDVPQETNPEAPRSIIVEKLMHAVGSLRTTAAFATLLLLAASVVALLLLHRINARSRNSLPANLKPSSAQQTISNPSFEPQVEDDNRFQPAEDKTGEDFLIEGSSPMRLSFDHVKPFSTPYPVTTKTPTRTLRKAMEENLTPQKSFMHVADDDTSQSPDTLSSGVLEDSSLGRFITLVPVVHNEGTARERVQLTPVRRSSRIRTKIQNSPCNLMHPQHLCNC